MTTKATWTAQTGSGHLMHYSTPGVPRHEGQTADLADAREKATRVAETTRSPAAILAHYAVEGREEIRLAEVVLPSD
jgi:hypothetical protein